MLRPFLDADATITSVSRNYSSSLGCLTSALPLRMRCGRTVAPVVARPHLQSQAHYLIDVEEVHRCYRNGFVLVVFFGDKSTGGSSPASSSPSRTASPRRWPTPRPSTR
ncbi:hypothetical protein ZEAMMB73_Zm00001d040523 [Zea mays]|nr:hypothetical protein ZEAMMB73_Zm00001d040523 [Zea mays]